MNISDDNTENTGNKFSGTTSLKRYFGMADSPHAIRIITRRAGYNFGSSLQAYAMQQTLLKAGFDNLIIDYDEYKLRWKIRPFVHNTVYRLLQLFQMPGKFIVPELYERFKKRHIQRAKFDRFDRSRLRLTSRHYKTAAAITRDLAGCRACVCGSDQIWSPLLFDPVMFLNFCTGTGVRKVAYAPSIGLDRITAHKEEIRQLTEDFYALSVREEQGAVLLRKLLKRQDIPAMPDPTLLLEQHEWLEIAQMPQPGTPYILCYFLGESVPHDFISNLQKKSGCRVVNIRMYYNRITAAGEMLDTVSPEEFLGLVHQAAYVCTDSFHGTIFSILMERKFFCFRRFSESAANNQNSRIYNLLDSLHLMSRLCNENSFATTTELNYVESRKQLAALRKQAFSYLRNALS